MVTLGHGANKKRYISTFKRLAATKLDRLVAYDKGSIHKTLHSPLSTWWREVSTYLQTKDTHSDQTWQGGALWREDHPQSKKIAWSFDHVITWVHAREEWETIYLHIHNVHSRQIWQGSWWLMIKIYHPRSHVALWSRDYMRSCNKWKTFYLLLQEVCCKETWQVVVYVNGTLTANSLNISIIWLPEVTWQIKTFFTHFTQTYDH